MDDQATHLVEMLRNATDPPRRRGAAWRHVDGDKPEDLLVADMFENFALLWEASSGDERWSERGALSLGGAEDCARQKSFNPIWLQARTRDRVAESHWPRLQNA